MLKIAMLIFLSQSAFAAPESVEAWKKMVGTDDAIHHPVHLKWKGEMLGLKGTEEDDLSGTRSREHTLLPELPFEDTTIVENKEVIDQDSNGQIKHMGGMSAAKELTFQNFFNGTWLNDTDLITELTNDLEGRKRVLWSPKNSAPAEITFANDHTPAEILVNDHGEKSLTILSNWTVISGVRLPQKQVSYEPDSEEPQTWELQSASSFDDKPFPALIPHQDWHLPEAETSITLPLSLYLNSYILVPVTIGKVHSIFLLDTGASSSVISLSLAKKLGLPLKGKLTQPAGIMSGIYFVRAPEMELGGAKVDPQTIIALDLDSGEFASHFPGIGGIIGFDFLSRFVTVIDYQKGRLSLWQKDRFKPEAGDVSIPVEIDGSSIILPVEVNQKSAKFVLDTGNGGVITIQHVSGQNTWVNSDEKKRYYDPEGMRFGSGMSGSWRSYANVKVGPFFAKHSLVEIADENTSRGGSLVFQGNIGVKFLNHFRVSLEMGTPKLWLAQTLPFQDRKHDSSFGVGLNMHDQDVVIDSLVGAGKKSGLKLGDVVTEINNMDALKVLPYFSNLAESVPGDQLHLEVKRNEKLIPITVTAEFIP